MSITSNLVYMYAPSMTSCSSVYVVDEPRRTRVNTVPMNGGSLKSRSSKVKLKKILISSRDPQDARLGLRDMST